jgi:hypothetical protein
MSPRKIRETVRELEALLDHLEQARTVAELLERADLATLERLTRAGENLARLMGIKL